MAWRGASHMERDSRIGTDRVSTNLILFGCVFLVCVIAVITGLNLVLPSTELAPWRIGAAMGVSLPIVYVLGRAKQKRRIRRESEVRRVRAEIREQETQRQIKAMKRRDLGLRG